MRIRWILFWKLKSLTKHSRWYLQNVFFICDVKKLYSTVTKNIRLYNLKLNSYGLNWWESARTLSNEKTCHTAWSKIRRLQAIQYLWYFPTKWFCLETFQNSEISREFWCYFMRFRLNRLGSMWWHLVWDLAHWTATVLQQCATVCLVQGLV